MASQVFSRRARTNTFRTNLGGDDLAVEHKGGPNDVSSHPIFCDFYDSAHKDVQRWPGMRVIDPKRLKNWSIKKVNV